MKLIDFLSLIQDEEVRIELEIDDKDKEDYQYYHFWLSDFRSSLDITKYYGDYEVNSFSFEPEKERNAQISICIEQKL